MTTWNKRRVRQLLYEGLTPVTDVSGFRLHKGSEGFVRKILGGRQHISVALWDFHPEFQFSLTLCTRLDAVESLFHPFAETMPQYYKETVTALTQLEHLGEEGTPGRGVIYSVTTDEELATVLIAVSKLISGKVLPFLNRHTTLAALDAAMNPENVMATGRQAFDSSHHPYRGMRAVIVAYLNQNPCFEQLVSRYQEEMRSLISSEQIKFDRLVHYLRKEAPAL